MTDLQSDAELLAWLNTHGVPVVISYGVDLDLGKVKNAVYNAHRLDLAKLREGLAELVAPYADHIAQDHEALRKAYALHGHGKAKARRYCPEDGFSAPCPTARVLSGRDEELEDFPATRAGRNRRNT